MNPDLQRPSVQPSPLPSPAASFASSSSLPAGVQVGSLDNFSDVVDGRSSNTIADTSTIAPRKFVPEPDLRSSRWWKRKLKTIFTFIAILLLFLGIFWLLKATIFKTKPPITIPATQTPASLNNSSDGIEQNPGTVTINRDLVVTNAATFEKTVTIQGDANVQKDLQVQGNGTIGGNLTVLGSTNLGGTVTAGNFIGNGSGLTGIQASNCTDCTRQQGVRTTAQAGNIHIAGSVRAANFIGDGSQLTGIPTGCDTCVALQPTNPGTAQNGNINVSGNVQGGTANFQGQVITGDLIPSISGGVNQGIVQNTIGSTVFTGANMLYNDSVRWSAVGPDGLVRLVYFDNDYKDLKFLRCTNQDCTTSVITTINSNLNTLDFPTIAFGTDGLPQILYHNYNGPSELHFIHCTNQDCTTSTNVLLATGSYYTKSLAIGSDGFARISFVDYNVSTQIAFIRCTNIDCSTKVTTSITGVNKADFTTLYLGSDGFPRIAYEDTSTVPNKLGFIKCLDANCSTRTITSLLTGQASYTYYMVATNGPDGLPRIAYSDYSAGTSYVKFVRCTTADCSSSVLTTIASTASYIAVSGLSMGLDGFPRLAYDHYINSGGIMYAQCLDADCITKNTVTVGSNGSGYPSSMVLGQDGYARVIYYRLSDKTLRFARFTNNIGFSTVTGSNIGNSSLPYGQITATALTLQGDLQNALLLKNSNGNTVINVDTAFGITTIQGSVGIGTTSPTAPLDVVSNTTPAGRFAYTGAITQTTVALHVAGGIQVDGDSNNTGSTVFIKGNAVDGQPGQIYTGYWVIEPALILGTYSNRANQLTLATNSFVGIGTTAPAYKLDVLGEINSSTALRVGGNIVCTSSGCIGGGGGSFFTQGGNSFGALAVMGTNDNNAVSIRTNGAEAVRINTGGNVGIGTTTPTAKLEVNGNITAQGVNATLTLGSNSIAASGNDLFINSPNGNYNFQTGSGGFAQFIDTFYNVARMTWPISGGTRFNAPLTGSTVLIAQGIAGQTADLLQAQDSAGTVLASIDKVGNLAVKNATINGTLSVNGHIITANASGSTIITAGAAACTVPTVSVAGNDTSGTITITTGTGCASGGVLGTITFANAYGSAPRVVMSADNTSSASLQYYTSNRTTASFELSTNTTPVNTTTYTYNYQVLQ